MSQAVGSTIVGVRLLVCQRSEMQQRQSQRQRQCQM